MGIKIILKYFATIGVLFGLINTFFIYKRIKSIRANNNEIGEEKEVNNFIMWFGILFTVPFVFIQIFQLLGNYNTVFYIFLLDFNNIYYTLGFASIILFWGLIIYLMIIKNGAEIMSKYNKAFGNFTADKNKIKLSYILIILGSLLILLFGNKISGGAVSMVENMFVE